MRRVTIKSIPSVAKARVAVSAESSALPRSNTPDALLLKSVKSISEFVEAAMSFRSDSGPLWFRGHSQDRHKLVPSLYRNADGKVESELRKIEEHLNRRFRDRSMPHGRDETSDSNALQSWWRMFTMQHYGTPTRLLDWSENAMTALCFSLFGAAKEPSEHAVVWLLHPQTWNNIGNSNHTHALSVDEHGAGPYSPLPSTNQHVPASWPLAIYGMHNSPRIVRQQGTFVIFAPANTTSMEAHALERGESAKNALMAIQIDKEAIPDMVKQLHRLGFAHSSL
ncbi:MAG: FRG domain-containing protein, partial [Moraxellaceae bacterium]